PDLAVITNSGVSLLLGQGDGTFQTAFNLGAGGLLSSVGLGDFNGDGR
ncbi:MAG: VCBS repeat-containing protein, partial [Verrucomicrobia bacterium]|nr:VCBS repeat-containing protein [Verrucomicrobiota bacterium]